MQKCHNLIHKTGLAMGLATFLISSAHANPFQAQLLQTGYGNGVETETDSTTTTTTTTTTVKEKPEVDIVPCDPDALPNPNDNRDCITPCSMKTDGENGTPPA